MLKLTRGLNLKCACIYCVNDVQTVGFELFFLQKNTQRLSQPILALK